MENTLSAGVSDLARQVAASTFLSNMAERRRDVKAATEPDFLQFNDLACEAVGGKVSHFEIFIYHMHTAVIITYLS